MEQKAGAQISQRAFIQSLVILFILMMIAGLLTLIIPAGQYSRVNADGRETIDPNSFQFVPKPDYPIWRWFIAPIEVLGSSSGLTVIVIIVVLFFAGGAFAVMDKTGTLRAFIGRIVRQFSGRKYALLWMVSLAFMFLGATLGTFEEVVLLVPVMIALSYSLGCAGRLGDVHSCNKYGLLSGDLESIYIGRIAAVSGFASLLGRVVSHLHLHYHLFALRLVPFFLCGQNRP
jgi:uncharacterized ion transporter superfamily protein YfcC